MSKQQIRQLEAVARRVSLSASFGKKSDNEIADGIRAASDGFTYTAEWRELRGRVLAVYGCRCMRCGVLPRHSRSVNVDHIRPRKFFPELALAFDNLQVLCARCNKLKGNGAAKDYRQRHPLGIGMGVIRLQARQRKTANRLNFQFRPVR